MSGAFALCIFRLLFFWFERSDGLRESSGALGEHLWFIANEEYGLVHGFSVSISVRGKQP